MPLLFAYIKATQTLDLRKRSLCVMEPRRNFRCDPQMN